MAKSGYERLNKTLLWIEGPLWTFIKRFWKIAVIITLALICIAFYRSLKRSNADVEFLKLHLDTAFQQIKEYQDITGRYHAVAKKAIVQKETMKLYADSLAKVLSIKPKQVTEASKTTAKIEVKEKLKIDTQYVDSNKNVVKSFHFEWSDNWMKVNGDVGDSDSIHIEGIDTLTRVDYWQRKKILGFRIGQKEYFADFNHSNPHIRVTGYKGVSLSQKPKHWSIGPSVQWFYPMKITAGISLQYSIIRF